jgi:hypothetical protein
MSKPIEKSGMHDIMICIETFAGFLISKSALTCLSSRKAEVGLHEGALAGH